MWYSIILTYFFLKIDISIWWFILQSTCNYCNLLIWVRSFSFSSADVWHMHNNGSVISKTHVDENLRNAILMNWWLQKKRWHNQTMSTKMFTICSQDYDINGLLATICQTFDGLFQFQTYQFEDQVCNEIKTVARTKTVLLVTKFSSLRFI